MRFNLRHHQLAFAVIIFLVLVGCTASPAAPDQKSPTWSTPTQVIPTWSESDLSNYDPAPSSVLLEADDRYMITDLNANCNRLPDVRIWGDGLAIYSHYTGQGREVLQGDLSTQQIKNLLRSLQSLGFTGAYTPEEVVPAPVSYNLDVNFKSGKVSRRWNYRPKLVDNFLEQLPLSEFSPYQPQRALLLVASAGSGGPSGDKFPEWPSNLGFSLADVPREGSWIEGERLNVVWKLINGQNQIPPGFRSGNLYYIVGLEIPGVSMMAVPYPCW